MARLDGIIRFRKWALDEQRRELAVLLEERAQIAVKLEKLDAEIVAQKSMVHSDLGSMTLGAYIEGARKKRAWILDEIRSKDQDIEEKQDVVADAFKELKTFEIADSRQKDRLQKELDRQEQNELDELGLQAFGNASNL